MSHRHLTFLVIALLLALDWFDGSQTDETEFVSAPTHQAPAPTPEAPTGPVIAELHEAAPAPQPVGEQEAGIVCPDGTTMPPLNGVNQRVRMQWHNDGPFTPVVAKMTHNGQDYYQHADGTLTSVVTVINRATGQPNIMSQVWSRGEVRPTRLGH